MAVFMNQKGISVERERPIERGRGGGEGRHGVSRRGGCTCIMTTQISKKPIGPARRLLEIYYPRLLRSARVIKRCFCPRRSVLRPFRRGAPRQRPANPMENRPRERRRKEKEREKEREGGKKHRQKSHFLSKYTPQEIPLSSNDTLSICRGDILRKVTIPLLLRCFDLPVSN